MHPRTTELLDYLDTHRSALRAALDSLPPELLSRRPLPERWSVAEVLEHLGLVERRITGLLAARIAAAREEGLGPELETGSLLSTLDLSSVLDRGSSIAASEALLPREGLDADTAWRALEAARRELRAMLIANDGLALGEVVQTHGRLGVLNIYQWILFIGGHESRHTVQIQEIAATLADRVE